MNSNSTLLVRNKTVDDLTDWEEVSLPSSVKGPLKVTSFNGKLFVSNWASYTKCGSCPAQTHDVSIWESSNNGSTWSRSWSGRIPDSDGNDEETDHQEWIEAFFAHNGILYAAGANFDSTAVVLAYQNSTWQTVWETTEAEYQRVNGFSERDGVVYFWASKIEDAPGGSGLIERADLFYIVEDFDDDFDKSTHELLHGTASLATDKGITGCSQNADRNLHHDPTGPGSGSSDWWGKITVKRSDDSLVEGVIPYFDVTPCDTDTDYPLWPRGITRLSTGQPTDTNGVSSVVFHQRFGGADSCTYYLKVGTTVVDSVVGGLSTVDIDGGGDVANSDLLWFQHAFATKTDIWRADYNRDAAVTLGDLSFFQIHFNHNLNSRPGPQSATYVSSWGGEGGLRDNDAVQLYLHVTPRLEPGTLPEIVDATVAIGAVASPGEVSVWLFASGYGGIRAVRAGLDWPIGWRLDGADQIMLDGQLFGVEGGMSQDSPDFATAFNAISGGAPVILGRVDLTATSAGDVTLLGDDFEVIDLGMNSLRYRFDRTIVTSGATGLLASQAVDAAPTIKLLRRTEGWVALLDVPSPVDVKASVYNVFGQRVAALDEHEDIEGEVRLAWDEHNEGGSLVASGVYLLRVKVGDHTLVRRMQVLR